MADSHQIKRLGERLFGDGPAFLEFWCCLKDLVHGVRSDVPTAPPEPLAPRAPPRPAAPLPDDLLTLKEAAAYMRISTRTLHRIVKAGYLKPSARVGRLPRFRRADLDAYLVSWGEGQGKYEADKEEA